MEQAGPIRPKVQAGAKFKKKKEKNNSGLQD